MTTPALTVSNVSKVYRQYSSELARILSWFNIASKPVQESWILHDISFTLEPGDAVGIVGQNGAGKSTLLKIITGTQRPTTGEIHVSGRIGAILELGMGFNPEFTGRQNAYHSAGLMGFSQAEIEAVMPAIESFAEVEEYFDQPVHTYSSGMQMRVAFSVITAFRPEILIVDEALSVGDTYFQHKCFDRIREFQKQGTSLLIVSHDSSLIKSLCHHAILIDGGRIIKNDSPEAVMDYYNALIAAKENENAIEINKLGKNKVQTVSGTREAVIRKSVLLNDSGQRIESVNVSQEVCLDIEIEIHESIPELVVGYLIKDKLGQPVFGTNTYHLDEILYNLRANQLIKYKFYFSANIGPGNYSIAIALHTKNTHISRNFEWKDLALIFNVVNLDKKNFVGVNWLPPRVESET